MITIIEDEPDISELIRIHLQKNGFEAVPFSEVKGFVEFIKKRIPDLVVLDIMLPDGDGLDLCKKLRSDARYRTIPIIILSARAEESDRVIGLELGADDYMVKPFSPRELLARIRAVLRRREHPEELGESVWIGNILFIDRARRVAQIEGKTIELTASEFKILELLATKPGWVFSRESILKHLWGYEKAVIDRTIDVHIKNLRSKLGEAGAFLKNVRGTGYKLEV
jgi:two-component system phosphate regulon response regulator PhoB/two-component system alkaline phosphatase synthesis response regulator PhoP